MSHPASRRLLAHSALSVTRELTPRCRLLAQCLRPFSQSPRGNAEGDNSRPPRTTVPFSNIRTTRPPEPQEPRSPSIHKNATISGDASNLANKFDSMLAQNRTSRYEKGWKLTDTNFASDGNDDGALLSNKTNVENSWQLHIYATKHNVHITVVRPPGWYHPQTGKRYPEEKTANNRTVALSFSAGNLGFRKSGRKHYDSAFQLASYVFSRMQESGMNIWIQEIEVFLRGFGAGREAVTKALLGTEGRYLRGKVIKVSDATRLKFGGTRSKKPRRLG